ncbi:MAG: tripartite tricarboxylate transporter TctB family protein, partial [Nitriliruptoraceae bacterium]
DKLVEDQLDIVAGLRPLGFYESGAIFLALISYLLTGDKSNKVKAIRNSVIFGVVGAAVLWLMFDVVLGIPTEKGILI